MSENHFLSPVASSTVQQHEVAEPNRAAQLFEALPDNPGVLSALQGKHIISIKDFSREQILQLLRYAAGYESGALSLQQLPSGSIMGDLFLDFTRPQIRLSFNHAWIKMGGRVLNIERSMQEMMANRAEAYQEVAELCSVMSDIALVLTQHDGVLEEMLNYFTIPVINAGNGSGEHPSHALADLYTIFKWRPDLLEEHPTHPLQIAVVGVPSYTRTIRSFLFSLMKFPKAVSRIYVMDTIKTPFKPGQREELQAAGLDIKLAKQEFPMESSSGIDKQVLPNTDIVYAHELVSKQVPRMNLIVGAELMKPNTMMLNPEIQTQEYANLNNNSTHNAYFAQARGAVFMRKALLSAVMGLYR